MNRLSCLLILSLLWASASSAGTSRLVPVTRVLSNGMRVVVLPRTGLPIVHVQLQVAAGLSSEAPGQSGQAYLTAQSIRQGTTSRSAEAFEAELDTLGATFAVQVTRDAAQVALGVQRDRLGSALELMSDAVINPLFEEDTFLRTRREIASQLGQAARTPASSLDDRMASLVFGAHPYANPIRGDFEGLIGATREHVRRFHRDHWRPNDAILVVAGDIAPETAFALVGDWFSRWGGTSRASAQMTVPRPMNGVWLVDLPSSAVVEVRLGIRAPGRGSSTFASWEVAREALEREVLPSGGQVTLAASRDASLLEVATRATPESLAVVVMRLRRAVSELGRDPVAWGSARQRALGTWALGLETLGQWASSWLAGVVAGLDDDHLRIQAERIATASAAPVQEVIQEGTITLLRGPAYRMKAGLGLLGRVDTLTAGGRPSESSSTSSTATAASEEMRRRGQQLIGLAVQAHGGWARLRSIYVSLAEYDVVLTAENQSLSSELRELRVNPDRFVSTARLFSFEARQVLDRNRGWLLSTAGDSASVVDADSTMLENLRTQFDGDLVHLLRAASAPDASPIATDTAIVDRTAVERVEFFARNRARMRLSLDAVTHRVVQVESAPNPQGDWRDRRRWFDFAELEGVLWPRQSVRELDGQEVQRMKMRRLTVNGDVDTMLFRRPLVVRGQIRAVE